ncbi:MAG TPA: class D sortase [Gaiellaceae bacterium]|nr:class D sortase [Gaiellaceae bacterium]
MRRVARVTGGVLVVAGVLTLAWAITVWQWQDPFTALYTHWQQDRLSHQLQREERAYTPATATGKTADLAAERQAIALDARRFQRRAKVGQPIGRIVIGRIGLNMVLVNGTDEESLKKGPGRDLRSYMPGENRLVYIAGHRTTYLAPFSEINDIRDGDYIRLEMPYGTFVYRTTHHRIVLANDMSVLRSPDHEQLELQACHPRFFATHRYIVYATLVSVLPRGMPPYQLEAAAVGVGG